MPSGIDHPAAWPPDVLLKRCEVRRLKRGGPGGQHRNKVETAVIIFDPQSGLSGEASERRSQEANRQVALFRLRVTLALEPVAQFDPAHLPSDLWKSRLRGEKLSINSEHADFPAMLAEAVTALHHSGWDVAAAASVLECSTSQLVKFLKNEPRALRALNNHRRDQGLRPLK